MSAMKTLTAVLIVTAVALAGTALAQEAKPPAAERPMALTKEQHDQIDKLRLDHLKEMMPLETDLKVKELELGALWRADELNAKAIVAKVKEISSARGQLELARVNHRLAMYKVFTPEQRQMAQRFLGRFGFGQGRRGMRGGHGMMGEPGMMGGRGMRGQGRGKKHGESRGMGPGGGRCGGSGCGDCHEPGGPE